MRVRLVSDKRTNLRPFVIWLKIFQSCKRSGRTGFYKNGFSGHLVWIGVDRVLSTERIAGLVSSSKSETDSGFALDVESAENSDLIKNAIHRLPEDVRFMTTVAPVSQLSQI